MFYGRVIASFGEMKLKRPSLPAMLLVFVVLSVVIAGHIIINFDDKETAEFQYLLAILAVIYVIWIGLSYYWIAGDILEIGQENCDT